MFGGGDMKNRVSKSGKNAEGIFGNFTDLKVLVHGFNFIRKHREVRRNTMWKA